MRRNKIQSLFFFFIKFLAEQNWRNGAVDKVLFANVWRRPEPIFYGLEYKAKNSKAKNGVMC